ncbi:hypothetical protein FSARC_14392 [Fusarium sarcochroum]|uniref:Amino acid permease 2 n=1 Tax=Fusarium sarcochroum TaxID=1208366 RepID=A0A8H4WPP0_9HYPO|nr:hypothetical protein FSARC_14392 [Fusarium sarcochroum]
MADTSSKSSSDPSADMRGVSKGANNPHLVAPLLPGHAEVDDQDGFHNDHQDHLDMQRLGKKQQFKRTFSLWSSIGFVAIYMATWEFVLISLAPGFTNGGYAGVFWCFVTTTTAYSAVVASLAEMASMAPTSGGQYHWVSEFSPPSYQKVLSYASGWMTTLGWLASFASSCYTIAFQVQACINVTMPDFAFTTWQIALIMWAVIVVTIAFNTWGTAFFPQLETASLIGHLLGFFVVMISLWVLCDKNSANDVFLQFTDQSGWDSMGFAYISSQIYVLWCCFGSDSIVHLSEEVKNASIIVPRAIWWSYVGNVFFGFIMLITMLFCIGPLDTVIESDWPFITLFDRTGSQSLNLFFNVILWLLVYLGNITTLATCARETWAFARDQGLPGSRWIGHMDKKWHMPFNAVYLMSVGAALLSLIQIGSDVAFTVLVSLSTLGIMSTYLLSIGCVLLKRIKGEKLPFARWSLGRFGLAINAFSVLYSLFIVILCCFPLNLPVDTASANWAPLIWVGVIILAAFAYVAHGRKAYTPPVNFVEGVKLQGLLLHWQTLIPDPKDGDQIHAGSYTESGPRGYEGLATMRWELDFVGEGLNMCADYCKQQSRRATAIPDLPGSGKHCISRFFGMPEIRMRGYIPKDSYDWVHVDVLWVSSYGNRAKKERHHSEGFEAEAKTTGLMNMPFMYQMGQFTRV